jgi:hypothetical protein
MQLIRCTGKIQKEMGLKKSDLIEESPRFSFLGQWHTNLIYINRRKCILFVNDKTLFNFIVPDVSRAEIRKLGDIFRLNFSCVLSAEGYSRELVEKALSEYSEIKYGKSNDRSVLGSINDLAFRYEYWIFESGGVHSAEIPSIIQKLNRMPMKKKVGYIWPADEILKLYQSAT